jgi:starvation-inducible DNA-binding protein
MSKTTDQIVERLSSILADNFVLYAKTLNFHWNVVGERFYQLHKLFEEQYGELDAANDELAERIRMLGEKTPASLKSFLSLTSLKEVEGSLTGNQMLEALVKDHETIIKKLHESIAFANDHSDEGTGDLLIQRLRSHEKMAWFLRSHFETKRKKDKK